MALWMKKEDGTLVEVSGGGGSSEGEHVITGDPTDPAMFNEVAVGQLLYDGVEGGGSGDGGPHDHAEYALVEHDHDYLPLSGGTLTGDLEVHSQNRSVRIFDSGENNYAELGFTVQGSNVTANGRLSGNAVVIRTGGSRETMQDAFVASSDGNGKFYGDLQVDGNSDLRINKPADFWNNDSGTAFSTLGMLGGTQGSYATSMTSNGYRNTSGTWTSMGNNGNAGAVQISLLPTGTLEVRTAANHPTGAASNPPARFTVTDTLTRAYGDLRVDGTINGTLTFNVADDIDTADVLERAETATMPVVDDEGVATTDADVESITVNEVVTALLAKIKELSAEIEELKGA